jgi:hypothetical protein
MIKTITKCRGDDADPRGQDLRVEFRPSLVVDIDISGEKVVDGYQANMKEVFDPKTPVREWFPRWIIEHGAPTAFREWQSYGSETDTPTSRKTKDKRKASISSTSLAASDAPPKRPRGRPAKHTQASTLSAISRPQLGSTEDPGRGSPDFPDITELARRSTTQYGRHTTSRGVNAPTLDHDQDEIVDLTSD